MRFNVFSLVSKVPHPKLRLKALDNILEWAIPFNRNLGMRIEELNACKVIVRSLPRWRRRNHVGGAHACALALLGEYPAGILVAQNYPPEKYRFIISHLEVDYKKQGRGQLKAEAMAPKSWPLPENGEAWIEMRTDISNEAGEEVAVCRTRWQVKDWNEVGKGPAKSN